MNRGKLALISRPWKCKKGKDRRSPLVHSRKLAEHDDFTRDFPAVTVTVVRDRKTRTALRTNQIVGFITVPSWKKIKVIMKDLWCKTSKESFFFFFFVIYIFFISDKLQKGGRYK